jgi:HEAT repeat protein
LSSDDQEVRSKAWYLLGDVSETEFIPALLEDLARHPAEGVRAGAALGLRQHRDDPSVRAALERAQADSSVQVQRAARSTLDGVHVAL